MLESLRSCCGTSYGQGVTKRPARWWERFGKDCRPRARSRSSILVTAGLEAQTRKRSASRKRALSNPEGNTRSIGSCSIWRFTRTRPAWRRNMAASIFYPPGSLARARSRLGNRRPDCVSSALSFDYNIPNLLIIRVKPIDFWGLFGIVLLRR